MGTAVAVAVIVAIVAVVLLRLRSGDTMPESRAPDAPDSGPKTATLVLRDAFWDSLVIDGISKKAKAKSP